MRQLTIGIVGRFGGTAGASSSQIRARVVDFIQYIHKQGHRPYVEGNTVTSLSLQDIEEVENIGDIWWMVSGARNTVGIPDAFVIFGGDGTMLNAAKTIAENFQPTPFQGTMPLLGVNHGRVGFITDMAFNAPSSEILEVITTLGKPETRTLLDIGDLALNDILINRSNGKILDFRVHVNGRFAYQTRADGVMVSTPTGSTAYAMSAGGPIIDPSANVLEVIPMLPQTMSYRPLVVSDDAVITLELIKGEASIYADGNDTGVLKGGESLTVMKSKRSVTFLHPPEHCHYKTLRTKLNWHLEPGTPAHNEMEKT